MPTSKIREIVNFPKIILRKKMEALSIRVAVIRHPNEYQKLLSTE
jgi:hypothetical protein